MRHNLLIEKEQLATKILLAHVPMALTFSDNNAKLYYVDCRLSDYRGNNNSALLWVWAVKIGVRSYTGLIYNSGIMYDNQTEISDGVFASFTEDNILNDEDENLNHRQVSLGIIIRYDADGRMYLKEEVKIPDNISAELALKQRHPKLKGGVVVLKVGETGKQLTYWAISTKNGYEGISPFSGEMISIPRDIPVTLICLGEPVGKGYYLAIRTGRFILKNKRATNR